MAKLQQKVDRAKDTTKDMLNNLNSSKWSKPSRNSIHALTSAKLSSTVSMPTEIQLACARIKWMPCQCAKKASSTSRITITTNCEFETNSLH